MKSDKDKYHLCVESKIWHEWPYLQHSLVDIENRLVVSMEEAELGRDGLDVYRMDKPQGPVVQYREVYSASWDNP